MTEHAHQTIKPLAVSVFIVKQTTLIPEYLLIRRCSTHLKGNWQMAGGGVDAGETAWQAALREMKEETGLTPLRLYSADYVEIFYSIDRDAVLFIPVFIAFVDDHQDVRLSPQEHDAHQWLPYDKALATLEFHSQRQALKLIHKYFVTNKPNEFLRINF